MINTINQQQTNIDNNNTNSAYELNNNDKIDKIKQNITYITKSLNNNINNNNNLLSTNNNNNIKELKPNIEFLLSLLKKVKDNNDNNKDNTNKNNSSFLTNNTHNTNNTNTSNITYKKINYLTTKFNNTNIIKEEEEEFHNHKKEESNYDSDSESDYQSLSTDNTINKNKYNDNNNLEDQLRLKNIISCLCKQGIKIENKDLDYTMDYIIGQVKEDKYISMNRIISMYVNMHKVEIKSEDIKNLYNLNRYDEINNINNISGKINRKRRSFILLISGNINSNYVSSKNSSFEFEIKYFINSNDQSVIAGEFFGYVTSKKISMFNKFSKHKAKLRLYTVPTDVYDFYYKDYDRDIINENITMCINESKLRFELKKYKTMKYIDHYILSNKLNEVKKKSYLDKYNNKYNDDDYNNDEE